MRGNSGRWVELPDGRTGLLYNKDVKEMRNGKVPIHTYENMTQQDLFDGNFDALKTADKKIMCEVKTLKVIGYFD